MNADISYTISDKRLDAETFLSLVQKVWPGHYDPSFVQKALDKTLNVTAWHRQSLIGCVRILSDGYFFGTVPEVLVDPQFQRQGIGTRLMEMALEASPTGLFFGAQPGNEPFFEKLGYERGLQSYQRRKPRPLE